MPRRRRDNPPDQGFTSTDLALAGLGGLVAGSVLGTILNRRRQATVLPAGALKGQIQPQPRVAPHIANTQMSSVTNALLPGVVRVGGGHGFLEGPVTRTTGQLKATSQLWHKPTPQSVPQSPWRSFQTIDDMMRACPSQDEMNRIRLDFNISFGPGVAQPWSCTDGGSESSVMLSVYNAFRLARAITFDAPMPILGVTNVYDWLKSLNLNWHFWHSTPDNPYNMASGTDVYLITDFLDQPTMRVFQDYAGNGMGAYVGLLLHEARHTDPGGAKNHVVCPAWHHLPIDPSLAYGGAFGLEYWYEVWLGSHTYVTPNPLQPPPTPAPPGVATLGSGQRDSFTAQAAQRRYPGTLADFCDEIPTPPPSVASISR